MKAVGVRCEGVKWGCILQEDTGCSDSEVGRMLGMSEEPPGSQWTESLLCAIFPPPPIG